MYLIIALTTLCYLAFYVSPEMVSSVTKSTYMKSLGSFLIAYVGGFIILGVLPIILR